jgi:hypothetical protein
MNRKPKIRRSDKRFPGNGVLHSQHMLQIYVLMELKGTLGGLVKQIDNLDQNVGKLSTDVAKHGKWIFCANVILLLALGIIGFIASVAWDIAKSHLGVQ